MDNTNFNDISMESFYKEVSNVSQNIFLFDDSIKNNITLYSNYPDREIDKAIHLSNLDDVISNLDNDINTVVSENYFDLSGGQKQRIAIARCILKNSDILIMDEATSALDNINAIEIENTILNLDNTVISITHKSDPQILNKYNKIFVLKDGKIIKEGKFKNLQYFRNFSPN